MNLAAETERQIEQHGNDRDGRIRRRARYDGPVPERRDALGWATFEPGEGHPPGDQEIWDFRADDGRFWSCPRYDLVLLDEEPAQ